MKKKVDENQWKQFSQQYHYRLIRLVYNYSKKDIFQPLEVVQPFSVELKEDETDISNDVYIFKSEYDRIELSFNLPTNYSDINIIHKVFLLEEEWKNYIYNCNEYNRKAMIRKNALSKLTDEEKILLNLQ